MGLIERVGIVSSNQSSGLNACRSSPVVSTRIDRAEAAQKGEPV
jgi:hypothetical protein